MESMVVCFIRVIGQKRLKSFHHHHSSLQKGQRARTRYLATVCPQGLTPSIWPQWDLFALEYVKMRQVFAVIYCSKKYINLNPQITVFCLPTRYNSMNYAFLLECFQLKLKVLRKCVFRILAIHILVDFVKVFFAYKVAFGHSHS
jgi:hypothetical protein